MDMAYAHVKAHQDRVLPWSMLTIEQQLNVICDSLANGAVVHYLANGMERKETPQFLPFEKVAIVLNSVKLATDVGAEV
jgi:hypothetical protein